MPADRARRRGKQIGFWLRLLAALAILAWVIGKNGQGRILETLTRAKPGWVALGAGVFFLSVLAGAYQWFLLLRIQGIGMGYGACFRAYYSGMFLNNFLPGTVGGDALRVYVAKQGADGWGKAVAATFLDRLIGFFSLSLLSLVAAALTLWRRSLDQSVFRHLLYAVGLVFGIFMAVLLLLLSRRIASLVHALIQRAGMRWLAEAHDRMRGILHAYRARWREMLWIAAVSCAVQALRIDVHWLSGIALGVRISPVFYFCFIPVIALAGVVPLNVGGWGIPQSIGTYLYTLPGVLAMADKNATAVALAFLPSVVGLVVMLGGGVFFVAGRKGGPSGPSGHGREEGKRENAG